MTDQAPIETTNFGPAEQTAIAWSRPRDLLAAPPPPDTPGGHFPSYLGTVRPDGRPHATGVGARWYDGDIYFLSGPGTRKSRNLAVNPACTIAMRLGRTSTWCSRAKRPRSTIRRSSTPWAP